MTRWSENTKMREARYEDVAHTKNTKLVFEVMAKKFRKDETTIEKAMKKLKEIGNTEI